MSYTFTSVESRNSKGTRKVFKVKFNRSTLVINNNGSGETIQHERACCCDDLVFPHPIRKSKLDPYHLRGSVFQPSQPDLGYADKTAGHKRFANIEHEGLHLHVCEIALGCEHKGITPDDRIFDTAETIVTTIQLVVNGQPFESLHTLQRLAFAEALRRCGWADPDAAVSAVLQSGWRFVMDLREQLESNGFAKY